MAIFNPEVQPGRDDMPNYFKYSEAIKQPQADQSKGLAYEALGKGIEGAASLADTTAKDIIGQDVRDTTEKIRSDFTNQLQQTKDVMGGGPRTTLMSADADANQPSIPEAINTGLSKVDSLQSALINGKINDTYYHQRLADAVTSIRAKYPGYTDYIDQKVAQVTGVNPANAVVGDLMQDINRMQSNKKSAVDKAVDDAMKSGYPNSGQMIQRLQQEGDSFLPQFQQWYSS